MARFSNSRRGVTFVLSAAILATFFAAPTMVAADEAAHLAHARQHGRMIRKRAPLFGFPDGHDTTTTTSTATSTSASATDSAPTSTASSTASGDFWDTLTSLIADPFTASSTSTSTSTSTTTSSTISTSSFSINATSTSTSSLALNTTTSTTSTTSTTLAPPPPTTSTTPLAVQAGKTSTVIVGVSGTTTSAQETGTGNPSAAATQGVAVARKTIVVLVSIAGSIGLAFLIWTGIRKWKFRPSSRFEDRMQDPINWQPNNVGYDTTDPASRIEAHRRNGSAGSHGSFGSSEMTHNNAAQPTQYTGYGATGMGATGVTRSLSGHSSHTNHQTNDALPPLPPHDFTAGAGGSDSYDFYHNQSQHMNGTAASPPQMVENGLTRGGAARPVSMRSENPYDGLDDDYDQRPGLPPHHGGAYHNTSY